LFNTRIELEQKLNQNESGENLEESEELNSTKNKHFVNLHSLTL